MTIAATPDNDVKAGEQYTIDTVEGYVLLDVEAELTDTQVRRITFALLALGYRLCDPFEVEPQHVPEGVRYFIDEIDNDERNLSWQ
jgi:hypothetical protein